MKGSFILQSFVFVFALFGVFEPAIFLLAGFLLAILQLGTASITGLLLATKSLSLYRTIRGLWLWYGIGVVVYIVVLIWLENPVFGIGGAVALALLSYVATGLTAYKPEGFQRRGSFLPNTEF